MKRYLLLLALISFTITVYCQQVTFQKTYGGTGVDIGSSVQQTTDGGYIITGWTFNFIAGLSSVYLIKTDAYGDTLWTKILGGSYYDYAYAVQQTSDGGYIIAGNTLSFSAGTTAKVYLIKTDTNGDLMWAKTFGGIYEDQGYSVQQTTDGGYIVGGRTLSFGAGSTDVYLIKTDANGDSLWTKTYGGINDDEGFSVQQTIDGGYIIAGNTHIIDSVHCDIYLIKTDANGDSLWTKSIGGPSWDIGNSVQQTTDGGYIITGYTESFAITNSDVYLVKTDSNGSCLWSKTYGGSYADLGYFVRQTTDGGYIITGYKQKTSLGSVSDDIYLIKTDINGDTLWTKIFGGTDIDIGYSVQQTIDGGYIITGYTASFGSGIYDLYLIKTDSLGNSGCNDSSATTFVTIPATQVTSPITVVTSPATVVTTPATIVGSGGSVTTLCTTVGISQTQNEKTEIEIYPNPFTERLNVSGLRFKVGEETTIIIYDLMGEKVYQQELPSNKTSAALNLSFLQQGVFFLNVKANGESWTRKIVKM